LKSSRLRNLFAKRTFMSRTLAVVALALATMLVPLSAQAAAKPARNYRVYVGTYTGPESKGIYSFHFDAASGKTTALELAGESTNPSFVAIDAAHRFLYAVNEVGDYKGEKSGGVSAFAIDAKTGKLTFLNEVSSHGADPCHLSFDKTGKHLLVANYTGGSVAVFPILADGRLGEASSVIQHTGHGPNAERQEAPHAHEIQVSSDNHYAVVADLGLDGLLVYQLDSAKGTLVANDPPMEKGEPGAGPRHFVFDRSGKFVYTLNEMGGNVTRFAWDGRTGTLKKLDSVASVAADYRGHNDSAEIAIDTAGKHVYASNRGPDDIAVFAVDAKGALQLVERVPTKGKAPRHFALDPTGKFLFVGNQESNNIAVFRVDPRTGRLTDTGQVIAAPAPVCIVFVPE